MLGQVMAARKRKSTYHHGNLRAELGRAALELAEKGGVAGITVAGVTAKLGVSAPALYRHFANREDLIGSIVEDGLEKLREALLAIEGGEDPREWLIARGLGYLKFAIENPVLFRVIFASHIDREQRPEVYARAESCLSVIVETVEVYLSATNNDEADPRELATQCWGAVHGISGLIVDGVLGQMQPPLDAESLVRSTLERMIRGSG